MKVLLVRPDSDIQSVFPPLGLLYIGAYLRERGRHEVRVVDARQTRETPERIAAIAAGYGAEVIGITSLAGDFPEAGAVAQAVKRRLPFAPVIMGGAYVTSDPTWFFRHSQVDYCVAGEGEMALSHLLAILDDGTRDDLKTIPGVYWRQPDGSLEGAAPQYVDNLDELPPPAWDLIDVKAYFANRRKRVAGHVHNHDRRSLPLMTSRGCPFRCAYCHDIFGSKVRTHSRERVLDDYDRLRALGAKDIEIADDIFNVNLNRATDLLNGMANRGNGVHISMSNGLRGDIISDDFLDACRRANVYRINYAIESASPRIQKLIGKNLDLEKVGDAITKTVARRFSVGGFFMFGFPEETLEEMQRTIDFAVNSELTTATFGLLAPFPNTGVFRWAVEHGYIPAETADSYCRVWTNLTRVPSQRLNTMRLEAFRRFYMNPRRVYRYFRDTPVRTMIAKKAYFSARMAIRGDVDAGGAKFW